MSAVYLSVFPLSLGSVREKFLEKVRNELRPLGIPKGLSGEGVAHFVEDF